MLLALGIPSLINSMLERAEKDADAAPTPRAASDPKPNSGLDSPSTVRAAPSASTVANRQ
jgi:hypothetical protein